MPKRKNSARLKAKEVVLAVDGLVLGSTTGKDWTAAGKDFAARHPALTFRPFGVGTVGTWDVGASVSHEEVDGGNYVSGRARGPWPALLAGFVPRATRRVSVLAPGASVYRSAVAGFLVNHGLQGAKFEIARIMRADLDGDGTQEVLIEARSGPGLDGSSSASLRKGAFSLVLLRFVSPKGASQVPLEFTSRLGDPPTPVDLRSVRAITDVDGDGRMEVITGAKGYEWQNATLWSYRRGAVRRLLKNGGGV